GGTASAAGGRVAPQETGECRPREGRGDRLEVRTHAGVGTASRVRQGHRAWRKAHGKGDPMKACRLVLPSVLIVLVLQLGLSWAQTPKYGGTLRIALSGEPAFFNANQGPAPGAPAFFISNSIYNSLLTLTPPPELKIEPDLA